MVSVMTIFGSSTLYYALLLCAALATAMFDRPTSGRSYTTLLRYGVALILHVAFHLWILLLAYVFLWRIGLLAGWSHVTAAWIALAVATAALILPQPSTWLRNSLHRLADIPAMAFRTTDSLADAEVEAKDDVQIEARTTLDALGISRDYAWLPPAQSLYDQLFRATCLFMQLRRWDGDGRYRSFLEEANNDMFRLRQRFDAMSIGASRTLISLERLGLVKHEFAIHSPDSHDIDGILRSLVSDSIADACEDVSRFHREACLLATRGVLATKATSHGRLRSFHQLGFGQLKDAPPNRYFALSVAAAVLFVGIWLMFLLAPVPPRDLMPFQLQSLIMVSQLGAIAIALAPKHYFAFATGGLHIRTPWAFIISAGFIAVLFAVFVNISFGFVLKGTWEGVKTRLEIGAPYLGFAMLTSIATAWLMRDECWWRRSSQWVRRALDALVFGIGWLIAGLIAFAAEALTGGSDEAGSLLTRLPVMFLFGAAMGALILEYTRDRTAIEPDLHDGQASEPARFPSFPRRSALSEREHVA